MAGECIVVLNVTLFTVTFMKMFAGEFIKDVSLFRLFV